MTIKKLLAKHDIKHGIENDQARIDEFVKDLGLLLNEARIEQAKNDLEAMQGGESDYDWVLENMRDEIVYLTKRGVSNE